MFERNKTRGGRTELYLVADIVNALNAAELAIATHDGQRALDVIAATFGLRRATQYDTMPPQIVIEAPKRGLLR
jgi:phosphoglycolate phosphatase-like HAD superfamily hydrolase